MIEANKRKAIYLLKQEGMSNLEISRRLALSVNTIKTIVKQQGEMPQRTRKDKKQIEPELLQRLCKECSGYAQRVYEKLVEEEGISIKYSTLTRMLRELEINRAPKVRCGHELDQPGAEMQHDTSPYRVTLANHKVSVIASVLYLRYSKRRYVKFYRAFNRFTMKCFFHEALMFWEHAAPVCIIDNTNLARLRGIGRQAVIVAEMEAFAKQYGFRFQCHEKGHANRKAGEERSFYTIETNFFPGRTFQSMEDLNAQALQWATLRLENRPQAKTHLIPAVAFEHERTVLVKLLPHLPAPYLVHHRGTDQYGYVAFKGNYYFVPGTGRAEVKVLEYANQVTICGANEEKVAYMLPAEDVKNQRFSPPGYPKPRHEPKNRHRPTQHEEQRLRQMGDAVSAYLDFALAGKAQGIERHGFVRKLYAQSQQMTKELFIKSVERAHRYKITGIETIERIAAIYLKQGMDHSLPSVEVNSAFCQRSAYVQGALTDYPDLSIYDDGRTDDVENPHG